MEHPRPESAQPDRPQPPSGDGVLQWAPRPAELAVAAVGGAVLAVLAAFTTDTSGRVLVGVAALGLIGFALLGALRRPRLSADPVGVTVRGPLRTRVVPWTEVGEVLVRPYRRFGMQNALLEIGGRGDSDLLLVLGPRDLGADPREVQPALAALHLAALRQPRAGTVHADQLSRPPEETP